jgi:hypothetical protein
MYFSDVAITLFTRDYNRMVEQARETGNDAIIDFVVNAPVDIHTLDHGNITQIGWAQVRWQDWYEDVGFILNFLSDCVPYHLIRVGEDDEEDDVEEHDYLLNEDGGFSSDLCPTVKKQILMVEETPEG